MTNYPSKPLSKNSTETAAINAIQAALKTRGLSHGLTTGVFNAEMQSTIKLFQSRNVDAAGYPLKVDGIVGSFTWLALFKPIMVTALAQANTDFIKQVLANAVSQIGEMETTGKPNRGAQVDIYLKAAGKDNPAGNPPDGYPWCQAYVYWCFMQASQTLAVNNPAYKTAGVLKHWQKASANVKRITKAAALANPSIIKPGMIFINSYGQGKGHTGFVESVYPDGRLVTVEGNTNAQAGAEGLGVFRLARRKLNDKELKGFLDYSSAV